MVLENLSQNKWNSESNVSKNTPKPCASNFSERVKKLIQKYEDLSVSAKNTNLQRGIKCSSEQNINRTHSEMVGDTNITLNNDHVYRFLSLDHDKYIVNKGKSVNNSTVYSVNNICDNKMPSHTKKSSKPKFYVDELFIKNESRSLPEVKRKEDKKWQTLQLQEKDKKHLYNRNVPKETYNKYTYEKSDQQYGNSLPSGKKKDSSFGKSFIRSFSATTSRDKKSRPLSNSNQQCEKSIDKKLKTMPKDGNSIVKTQIQSLTTENSNTGAIRKQLASDDIIYRKRRDSYIMATQNDENHRKLKIYPDDPTNKQSYVSKTISKFETQNDDIMKMANLRTERTKNKVELEIKQLLKKYHDNKQFGTSNKMTREELSLEIDNVLLNKYKQISSDSLQETHSELSDLNHSNSQHIIDSTPQNLEEETTSLTLVLHQEPTPDTDNNDIQTEYVIILEDPSNQNSNVDIQNSSQGCAESNLDGMNSSTESDLNVREKLSAELNKVLSDDNIKNSIKGSVENLFEDIEKDLSALNRSLSDIGVEISGISVTVDSEEENMIENVESNKAVSCPNNIYSEERIYENLKYIQDKIQEKNMKQNTSAAELNLNDIKSENHVAVDNAEDVYTSDELKLKGTKKPKRKVTNLVNFFSEIITSENKKSTLDNRKTSCSSTSTYVNDEVFQSPTIDKNEEYRYSTASTTDMTPNLLNENFNSSYSSNSSSSEGSYDEIITYENCSYSQKSPTIKVSCIDDYLKEQVNILQTNEDNLKPINTSPKTNNEHKPPSSYLHSQQSRIKKEKTSSFCSSENSEIPEILPQRSSLYSNQSFRSNVSSEENFDFFQYINKNVKTKKISVEEQTAQLQNEVKEKYSVKSKHIQQEQITEEQTKQLQNDNNAIVLPKRQHSFNSEHINQNKLSAKEQTEQLQNKQNVHKKHSFNSHRRNQDKLSAQTGNKQTEQFRHELKKVHNDSSASSQCNNYDKISVQKSTINKQNKQIEHTGQIEQIEQIKQTEQIQQIEQVQEPKNIVCVHQRNESFSSQNSSQGHYEQIQDPSQIGKETIEFKPRFSRLYSGKFSKSPSAKTIKQDTNNNECTTSQSIKITKIEASDNNQRTLEETEEINEKKIEQDAVNDQSEDNDCKSINETKSSNGATDQSIYESIKNDTLFYSDSEGDYDLTEAYNDTNLNFVTLEREISTNEWVQNTIDRIKLVQNESFEDFDEEEDTEHIYERIQRSGSTMTIYDDQNNPAIRLSMIDIIGDLPQVSQHIEDKKIEESEKLIRKSIEEMQDNSRKACLINELINTEKNYINISLHRLVNDYMPEMDKEDIPKGLAGKSRQIFGNADMIYEGHKDKFLPALENHTCIEELADSFLKHETIFKLYPLYSKNKPKSDVVLRDFNTYFKTKQDSLNDKLDLQSYLLTPIQRLAKYCLLVKSLVKECEKENIACEKLKSALEMLNKQMRMGNDLIALDSVVGYNGSMRDHGEVLLRDTFMVQPPNKKVAYEGMIFLFQECLIITAVQREDYKETFLYKENFQLTDMGYSDTEPLEFSVWYRKRDIKKYRFRTKYQDLKQKWVKEIFNLLWKQLEANKRRIKKENEEKGVKDTRVPLATRPYTIPNKGKGSPSSGYSSTKSTRKRTLNSSADTIWYALTS